MAEGNGNGKATRVSVVTDNDWFKLVSRAAMIACAAVLGIASFFAQSAWETLGKVAEASVVQTQTLLHHAGRIDDLKTDQKTLGEKQQMISDRVIILETKARDRWKEHR